MLYHWHDRAQVPSSPFFSETVLRHSLPDDTAGSVQTNCSLLADRVYLSTSGTQPVYATQAPQRPPVQFHQQYRASPPQRPARQFTQLGMPLSRAFQRLVKGGLIPLLPPRPPPHPTLLGFRTDLHYAYHQRAGHDTNNYAMLRHAI